MGDKLQKLYDALENLGHKKVVEDMYKAQLLQKDNALQDMKEQIQTLEAEN